MNNSLLKSSALIFLGSMIGNIFNYLFQASMGRMLSVQTFGEMNALFSLMIIFSVPFASITNFLAKNVANFDAFSLGKQVNTLIIKSYKVLLIGGSIIFLCGVLFSQIISGYLKISSTVPIILLFLSISMSVVIPVNTGMLQGLKNFKMLFFVNAGSSTVRYIICILLVFLGMGLNGVLIGAILSVILIGYISFLPILKHLKAGTEPFVPNNHSGLFFIIPVFVANLSFAILSQGDIILVKYFFTPYEAGIYSSAAVIGKAVMYLPGAIVISLFPMVASNKARDKGTLHLILKALAITVLLSGGGALILYLFPEQIISIFFGRKFMAAPPIVGLFAIAMMPLAIITIIMNYNMAKGGKYFAYVMIAYSIIQVAGIMRFHTNLESVLKVILYTGLLCMFTLFSLLILEYFKGKLQDLAFFIKSEK
jgi:O-antigen/teichoic acid export membrane protein